MTASVQCTTIRFPEFSEAENSETKRDFLLGYFHQLGDISMVQTVRDEPTGSSYVESLYLLISGGGTTELN